MCKVSICTRIARNEFTRDGCRGQVSARKGHKDTKRLRALYNNTGQASLRFGGLGVVYMSLVNNTWSHWVKDWLRKVMNKNRTVVERTKHLHYCRPAHKKHRTANNIRSFSYDPRETRVYIRAENIFAAFRLGTT